MERKEFRVGRREKVCANDVSRKRKKRPLSESALFTLGLVFIIVYFAGLICSTGVTEKHGITDAVAVMAEQDGKTEDRGIWDILEDGLREAFGVGDGGAE